MAARPRARSSSLPFVAKVSLLTSNSWLELFVCFVAWILGWLLLRILVISIWTCVSFTHIYFYLVFSALFCWDVDVFDFRMDVGDDFWFWQFRIFVWFDIYGNDFTALIRWLSTSLPYTLMTSAIWIFVYRVGLTSWPPRGWLRLVPCWVLTWICRLFLTWDFDFFRDFTFWLLVNPWVVPLQIFSVLFDFLGHRLDHVPFELEVVRVISLSIRCLTLSNSALTW